MSTKTEHRYYLGKCDADDCGKKVNDAYITWKLDEENGTFSACAEIWNPRKTDIIMGGQCVDDVAALFPDDKKAQSILRVWQEWHLNDLTAGSPAQEEFLKTAEPWDWRDKSFKSAYDWKLTQLGAEGLNPDHNYLHNGAPYKYGSAWLTRELPAEVIAEIKSWDVE